MSRVVNVRRVPEHNQRVLHLDPGIRDEDLRLLLVRRLGRAISSLLPVLDCDGTELLMLPGPLDVLDLNLLMA